MKLITLMQFKPNLIQVARQNLLLLVLFLSGCEQDFLLNDANAADSVLEETSFQVEVTVNPEVQFNLNPYLLGSNTQWVDRGDEMIDANKLEPVPKMLDKAKQLGVSVLRYPGGSLADLYHWKDGVGSKAQRDTNARFHGAGVSEVLFGTREFLRLCLALGAEPVITVNVITGTVQEAADWVKQTNITGFGRLDAKLPKVKYWEIGNEPYLIDDNQKSLAITPEEFARRATAFILAMKKIDPTIRVGIPLRSDTVAGVPATPMPGFNSKVLSGIKAPIDFVSVHNAYYPFVFADVPDKTQMYLAAMAASDIVNENFDDTNAEVKRYRQESNLPIALTEYNALFTLNRGDTDGYLASLAGGLFVADLLMTLGKRTDLLMANYWSLSGNWFFGSIEQDGDSRISHHVLEGLNRLWQGIGLETQTVTPNFDSPTAGFATSRNNIPLVNAIATREEGVTRVMLINKHPTAIGEVTLTIPGLGKINSISKQQLHSDDVFAQQDVAWSEFTSSGDTMPARLALSPHSLTLIEIR